MKKIALTIWIVSILLIIACSLLPDFAPTEKYNLDKLVHGSAYAGLAFLSYFFTNSRKITVLFIVIILAVGAGIEILQNYVPGRSGTIGDFTADSIGTIIGVLLAVKLRPLIIKWFSK